jgi:hypothetical protein
VAVDDRDYYQRVRDIVERTRDDVVAAEQAQPPAVWPRRLKRVLRRVLLGAVIAAAALYVGDYALLRYRMAAGRGALGAVEVDRFISIQKKANRTEFRYDGTETQACVNALLPHAGYPACWYLRRHREKRIEL